MEMEVICISSDDDSESDSQKENKTDKSLIRSTENSTAKMETLVPDNEKVEENSRKRKKLQTDEDEICSGIEKKKLNLDQDTEHKAANKLSSLCSKPEIRLVKSNCNVQSSKEVNQEVTIEKAQLIVKEKKKISYISQDVFPLFISLCLQKCPKHDKMDMNKIIDKLKRRYENLDPTYARSEAFVIFLNEKREAILNNNKKIYVHIEEVMNEMKKKIKKECQALQNNEIYDAVPSTSYATNNTVNNRIESNKINEDVDEENEENASPEVRKKIKEVLRAMNKCEAIIKKLEEEEVDFNEENDSNYIKVERYKQRMVELYNKLCELTGENADAGRVYLRPKHLNVTQIVAVDQAITNFINAKITRRNQMKRVGALTDYLIFPDYRDILECVNRCNEKKNLGLDKRRREQIAQKAFKELGEHLQRIRRNDYWDTFSIPLENSEDPATKDKNLAKKLAENRTEGEKRLAAVFEKYTKKQAEIKNNEEVSSEEEDEDEEEEEEENLIDDDNENVLMTSEKDTDDDENDIYLETVKETRLSIEKNKPNINVYHAGDKVISNKSTAGTVIKCNKAVEIKILKESDTAVSKNESKTINEKIHEPSCSNISLKNVVENVRDTKIQEDSSAGFTTNCTKDLAEVEINEVTKAITDPATKRITKGEADTITGITTRELATGDAAELITKDITKTITENTAEVITETGIIIENMMDGAIDIQNDEQATKEKKPVLRLRSFAKPPTTWEDKLDKIAQENAPKVTSQIKEIVDLTNEGSAKPTPVIAKCAVQLGDKVLPIVKHQTVLIPAHRNIISVQNITNNYLKVNTRTGQIIAPVRDIRGSTIIRLPSIQSTSRQSQNANVIANNEVPLKANETIFRIIPNKSIIISKKSAVQSVSKQTDVSSSTTNSK